jgi:hypothetical protein
MGQTGLACGEKRNFSLIMLGCILPFLTAVPVPAYPLDGAGPPIRRLTGYRLANEGKSRRGEAAAGRHAAGDQIVLRLKAANPASISPNTPQDPYLKGGLVAFGGRDPSYAVAILIRTAKPLYASLRGDAGRSPAASANSRLRLLRSQLGRRFRIGSAARHRGGC